MLFAEAEVSHWDWIRDFGTGWKGLVVLLVVAIGWVARGVVPDCYKHRLDYKKFLKEHESKMKVLEQRANERERRNE